ncbi:MAG: phosphate ABC transporter permease subunit PstC [Burkholderiales bacterium]|jgi:phosphate transport system permease protein|uniref:phosphate ABC transporter permease subunit PstC n=1 Tax=Limnobacter sp. TaxID=2003368 RepID=UPI00395A6A6C|nr:phosphate ABC transporter permease subunit PstC [Burkholderiales bacterium]
MIWSKSNSLYPSNADRRLEFFSLALTLVTASLIGLVLVFVLLESLPVINADVGSFFDPSQAWFPLEGQRGLVPMIVGSLLCTFGAIALALPLGVASALFSQYYGHASLVRPYRWLLGLLAGIPSVVYGFWGLTVLVPLIAMYQPPGASVLAGVIILAFMILPTVALAAESAFKAVPASYLLGAHALGIGKAAIAFKVLFPAARQGLVAGVVLAVTRALGETMAVLMVTGNVVEMPFSVFDPVRTLTANIAIEMAYATGEHRAALFFSGLVLTVLIMLMVSYVHRREYAP